MVRAFSSYLVFLELPAPYFLKHKLQPVLAGRYIAFRSVHQRCSIEMQIIFFNKFGNWFVCYFSLI